MGNDKAPKKCGSPSAFQGKQADFLSAWTEKYGDASQSKSTPKFWKQFLPQYWANFSWRLEMTEDPDEPIFFNFEGTVNPPAKETLLPEEEKQKSEIMKVTEKVKTCFSFASFYFIHS
jgi:hypothetical protein